MNKNKTIFMAALAVLALLLVGCGSGLSGSGLSSEEFQQKLIEANSNLKSYNMEMDMKMDMDLKGEGMSMKMASTTKAKGEVDVANKKMHMNTNTKANAFGQDTEIPMEMYMDGSSAYTLTQGQWIKMPFDQKVWDQQDSMKNQLELIKSGTIKQMPDETMDGKSYYVIKVTPDLRKLADQMMQGGASDMPAEIDFGKVIKEFDVTSWVNKDTFVVERSKSSMRMELSSKDLGKESLGGEGSMAFDIDTDVRLSAINEPVTITVPAAAMNAMDFSKMGSGSSPMTGNSVLDMVE